MKIFIAEKEREALMKLQDLKKPIPKETIPGNFSGKLV
jgi:hypothetical protein